MVYVGRIDPVVVFLRKGCLQWWIMRLSYPTRKVLIRYVRLRLRQLPVVFQNLETRWCLRKEERREIGFLAGNDFLNTVLVRWG